MRYAVVLEQGTSSFGAFVPDLTGCVVAGDTREEVLELIREAIEFHIEGLKENGETVPEPNCDIEHVEVNAAQKWRFFKSFDLNMCPNLWRK